MPITTGSYPAALGGGGLTEIEKKPRSTGSSPTSSTKADGSATHDEEFLAAMEKGYQPRKAMAAGIVKC